MHTFSCLPSNVHDSDIPCLLVLTGVCSPYCCAGGWRTAGRKGSRGWRLVLHGRARSRLAAGNVLLPCKFRTALKHPTHDVATLQVGHQPSMFRGETSIKFVWRNCAVQLHCVQLIRPCDPLHLGQPILWQSYTDARANSFTISLLFLCTG
ncbi:hypothetical protein VPH35_021197 [Triticum aestivum]